MNSPAVLDNNTFGICRDTELPYRSSWGLGTLPFDPIVIYRINIDGKDIDAREPLFFSPELGESTMYVIEDEVYNLHLWADSLEELEGLLYDQFVFFWEKFVLEEDSKLNCQALKLKYNLLSVFKE